MKKLTDARVKSLKPTDRQYVIGGGDGFGVRVSPGGAKAFVLQYRFEGKNRLLTIGKYPNISLSNAHLKAAQARDKISQGVDPGEEKIQRRNAYKGAHTVESLAHEYIERWAKIRKKTWKEDERCLNREIIPAIGNKKAQGVKRRDLILLVEDIRDGRRDKGEPAPAMANRTLNVLTRLFNWALEVDIIQTSPAVGLRLPAPKGKRDRYLTDDEIKNFWIKLDETALPEHVELAMRLILVTGQRRGEVAGAEWKELNANRWVIPKDKTKSDRAHTVPLSPVALSILGQVKKLSPDSEYLFPAIKGEGSMDPRLITRWCRKIQDELGIEKFNPHDLRRTCATGLGALGVDRFTIGKILNHSDSGVTGVYDVHEYFEQKKKALDKWARHLNNLIEGRPGKIISIK